jgi:hypothetical protein
LAIVVGVLVEVPVMLAAVNVVNRGKFFCGKRTNAVRFFCGNLYVKKYW